MYLGYLDVPFSEIEKYMNEAKKKKGVCKIIPRARFSIVDGDVFYDCLVCSTQDMGGKATGISASTCRNCEKSCKKNKYEYMIHTWGGFYNKEHQSKHGHVPGYRWFDTAKEREDYLSRLKEIEQRMNAYNLAVSMAEGTHTRMRTIATMTFVYRGIEYPCKYDFGFAYPSEVATFIFFNGSYSCDCNRSALLSQSGVDFPKLGCGHEIRIKDFEVTFKGKEYR